MPSDNPVISELDLGEPSKELLEYAQKEIGEDPETRCQVLAEFKDLIFGKIISTFFVTERHKRINSDQYN